MNVRALARSLAWTALLEYEKTHADPDDILGRLAHPGIPERDRALAWEITKGVIKFRRKLDFVAQVYMKAPMSRQKATVMAALRIGLYQLNEMSGIPQFAAVDEAVSLLSETGRGRDAGFVNAILRAHIREPERVRFPDRAANPLDFLASFYSYPHWLVKRWLERFGIDEAEQLMAVFNRRPPVFFRMLSHKASIDEITSSLKESGIEVEQGKYLPEYFSSDQSFAVVNSEPFKRGWLIAQEESQGISIRLLDLPEGAVVLDLCSAPGGKTVALADLVGPSGKVVSVDRDRRRLEFVKQNAARIGLGNIDFVCEDVLKFAPADKFEYILLDVPCSGLGTLWHNADLRWSKQERDIEKLARLQVRLLDQAGEFVARGGRLVYSTCTTEPDEIEIVVKEFLNHNRQFVLERSKSQMLNPFETTEGFYRTWPHRHGVGGGGFALLIKSDEYQVQ